MKNSLILALAFVGLVSGGILVLEELGSGGSSDPLLVQEVNANLMRVRFNGKWEDLPLMPLADHLCQSNNRLFDKYCGDDVLAPEDDAESDE